MSDEWETPFDLYMELCNTHKIYPIIDVCANKQNTKCKMFYDKKSNGLKQEWYNRAWANVPQKLAQKFIIKADKEFKKYNKDIIMITAINSTVTKAGKKLLWNKSNPKIYPLLPTPKFLYKGKPKLDKNGKPEGARNRYCIIIWRKKNGI